MTVSRETLAGLLDAWFASPQDSFLLLLVADALDERGLPALANQVRGLADRKPFVFTFHGSAESWTGASWHLGSPSVGREPFNALPGAVFSAMFGYPTVQGPGRWAFRSYGDPRKSLDGEWEAWADFARAITAWLRAELAKEVSVGPPLPAAGP
jgi:hypothetical protein